MQNVIDKQIKVLTQFILAFYDLRKRDRKNVDKSLTFFRVSSFYREFRWIQTCISQNAYHQSIRELRFVLESIVQAYYVDQKHRNSGMVCKLEIIKAIDDVLYGGKLIERIGPGFKHKQDLKDLYSDLSKYIHSTHKELESSLPKEGKIADLRFEPNKKMTRLCVDLVNRTLDAVFFVALSNFPNIMGPTTGHKKIREGFPASLTELGCKLTMDLNIVRSIRDS